MNPSKSGLQKFIIFAHARSGSTTLANVLSHSKDVQISIEPFHPKYNSWNPEERNYFEFIKDTSTLDMALEELFRKYNGLKILNYQFEESIYLHLLEKKNIKIILLSRKRMIDAVISRMIAGQTSIWQKDDTKSFDVFDNLKPVDIDEAKELLDYLHELDEVYRNFLLKNRKADTLEVYYEELFFEDHLKNIEAIRKIVTFLGVEKPNDQVIKYLMLPSKSKKNQQNLYNKLPNIKELLALGS